MAVTDAKGNVVETYNYTPYGELIDGEYREDIPFLYNGQYGVTTDSNGLYYMRARYYNVEIKRFINQDVLLGVLERVSSLNRYAYVEGNPISYLDPFGLDIYETACIRDITSVIGVIVSTIGFICPVVGFWGTLVINSFDIGTRIYDLVQHIRNDDDKRALKDIGYILYDILGIATAGVAMKADEIKEGFEIANALGNSSSGYRNYVTSMSNSWYGKVVVGTAAGIGVYINDMANYILNILKKVGL